MIPYAFRNLARGIHNEKVAAGDWNIRTASQPEEMLYFRLFDPILGSTMNWWLPPPTGISASNSALPPKVNIRPQIMNHSSHPSLTWASFLGQTRKTTEAIARIAKGRLLLRYRHFECLRDLG